MYIIFFSFRYLIFSFSVVFNIEVRSGVKRFNK